MKKLIVLAIGLILSIPKVAECSLFEGGYHTWFSTVQAYCFNTKIATGNLILDSITVISTGSETSTFEVYDSGISTKTYRNGYFGFSGNQKFAYPFNLELSSGLYINSIGEVAPKIHIKWGYKIRPH